VKTYDLYLHSGPKMMKTYIHVPSLMGCILLRDTTDEAVTAAPDVIRGFLAFLARSGERADPSAPFRTRVAQHDKSGGFIGSNFLPTDAEPLLKRESDALMKRLAAIHGELRAITSELSAKQLDAQPAKGRSIGRILIHLSGEGGYLRGVTGASRIQREIEVGSIAPLDGLDRIYELAVARLAGMTDAERREVVQRGQQPWSVRYAVRRMLEHAWEHYAEIATRLGQAP